MANLLQDNSLQDKSFANIEEIEEKNHLKKDAKGEAKGNVNDKN